MFAWLDDLNPQQRAAVLHDGGPLLIVAGAGSGKTRTLASRVARLVADGMAPERILLLTFSRRAAKEMLQRAARLTGDTRTSRVAGGTFHAMANRVLRQHGTAVGLDPAFTILDASDTADLLGVLRHELGLGEKRRRFPRKDTAAAVYSRVVNAQLPLGEVLDRFFPWCRDEVEGLRSLFVAYGERKRATGVVDYDDLLLYWRALAQSAEVGPLLREQFDHVLVDEYQDTNAVQADVLAAMCAEAGNVSAVGDDAQAIYGFRAASPAHMLAFPTRFAGTTVITLEQNYRSTSPILGAANAVMGGTAGFAKALWSTRPNGDPPELTACADEAAQADLVCSRVLGHRERGVLLRDQAVLFRTGHHSAGLELELARRNIPFVKYGGLKYLEAAHVKDALAMLRILDNPRDELAWHRVLLLIDGVGPAAVRRVLAWLGDDDPVATLLSSSDGGPFPSGAADDVAGLRAALADCRGDDVPPAVQVERVARFLGPIIDRRYAGAQARKVDLEELAGLASAFPNRSRLLSELTLDPPASTSDLAGPPHLDDDYLILSTIHSAKGGEWRVVHVIHASDGNIPSDMALSEKEGLEEERRLLYVALTRAKDALYVSYPQRYYHRRHGMDDAHSYGQPSRFLAPALACFERSVAGMGSAGGGEVSASSPRIDLVAGLVDDLIGR
ncbi:MAG: ATP-dependent helicase UvrD/PcrA [Actinomycetota bacterium]|jgi:DNA helicase-2/ATP-dependent DNA helicase PcrA|nr:ATP-dependent helicase UvrD/PcrA [Actinomycetota bacterium]